MAGIDIVSLSRNVVPYVIEQRRYFHCHPEPTSREFKTMKYIQNELDQMKIPYTNIPDGGILAEGILNVSFLYVKANDEVPFGVWKGMVPFSAMLECREGSSDMKYDVTYAVEQLAVDLAGNDEVEIKAVVAFRSFMRKAEKIQMVTEAALVDYEKEERMNQPGIVGYIVKDGDDLWSLAKKYSTTEESILLNNELLSKELKTGDKILIFRESLSIL